MGYSAWSLECKWNGWWNGWLEWLGEIFVEDYCIIFYVFVSLQDLDTYVLFVCVLSCVRKLFVKTFHADNTYILVDFMF